eukprot:19740-Heterococcus_DN1.PRE.4
MFGSSGHVKRPRGGVANYIYCNKSPDFIDNKHIKSIVNTDYVKGRSGDPHHFEYHDGYSAVNADFKPIVGPFNEPPTWTGWHLRHYVTKSREDYERKMKRGAGDGMIKPPAWFDYIQDNTKDVCLPLAQLTYAARLAIRMLRWRCNTATSSAMYTLVAVTLSAAVLQRYQYLCPAVR